MMPEGPLSLPLFLIFRKQWHLYALNEPLPATMAPFNPPPRVTAPNLTACVRRALDTKGGVSRFSAHFTPIHQRRNKSKPPCTLGRAEAGLRHPYQNATFFLIFFFWPGGGGGGPTDHTVFQDHCANMVPDYFYLQHKTFALKCDSFVH